MLKGVYLSLLIGPGTAVPAPRILMDALTNVQVTSSKDRGGFQITFSVGKNSPVMTTMLVTGFFDPLITRVILIATISGMPNVLMDGFITNHEITPSNEAGKSTLTITGEDVSVAMDIVQLTMSFPCMPEIARIYTVLAPFASLGVVPVVIPPPVTFVKPATDGWPSMIKKTSRAYIQEAASSCGYVFYVQPGPAPGQNIAYFGPDINLPMPQPALSVNMDAHSNVESLSFSMNGLAKKVRVYTILDPITRRIAIPVPVPNVNILKPPLGIRPTQAVMRTEFADDISEMTPGEAARKVIGDLMGSDNNPAAVTGNGSLDVMRYKGILRARMLVGVRGAGTAYDGMYYVDSVTHNIKTGEYKQSFTLSRDGLVSSTSTVRI